MHCVRVLLKEKVMEHNVEYARVYLFIYFKLISLNIKYIVFVLYNIKYRLKGILNNCLFILIVIFTRTFWNQGFKRLSVIAMSDSSRDVTRILSLKMRSSGSSSYSFWG